MIINRKLAVVLGAIVIAGSAVCTAEAGIRGVLSVYNQSANPYHVFVEGRRIGTVFRGQTLNVNVQDWQGPTELVAIQAGSQGQFRFVRQVRTCQLAQWELHTHWEQLSAYGGPEHLQGIGGPVNGGWHRGGQAAIGHGVGMIVRGANQRNPHGGTDIARGILAIIAGATRH